MRLIEESDVYLRACKLADDTAMAVHDWSFFAQKTVGVQLVTALDSIGANLVEGDGRGPSPDGVRFWRYSRGSAREARNWLHRAKVRGYIDESKCEAAVQELTEIVLMVHGLIRHRESMPQVKETIVSYDHEADIEGRFEEALLRTDVEDPARPKFPYSLIPSFPSPLELS